MLINKNGKIFFLEQNNENLSEHISRSWFIVNNIHNEEYKNLEKISKIWISIQNYNCIYSEKYMKVIEELKKNYTL